MLKWTVMNKRNSERFELQRRHTRNDLCDINRDKIKSTERTKRRHSSTTTRRRSCSTTTTTTITSNGNNRSLCLDVDKENQFTSTPIKSPERNCQTEALRDVSNLTPKDTTVLRQSLKNCYSDNNKKFVRRIEEEFSPVVVNNLTKSKKKTKKKKVCVDPSSHCGDVSSPNISRISSKYFKTQTVDSHIEGVSLFNTECCFNLNNNVAPTLPQSYTPIKSSMSSNNVKTMRLKLEEICPPNKRIKIDHVNDFLKQISALTSPEERMFSTIKVEDESLNISPLVKRLVDLNVNNNNNNNNNIKSNRLPDQNNSSYINNLSIDKIVDAILDSSKLTDENQFNESREENLINSTNERNSTADSVFRSSTATVVQNHEVDINFSCKCNNNNNNNNNNININMQTCDRTIINLDETYNERCVDVTKNRKRSSSQSYDYDNNYCIKKKFCADVTETFQLKRQKCIRRRKCIDERKDRIDDDCTSNVSFESNLSSEKCVSSSSMCVTENCEKTHFHETFTINTNNDNNSNDSSNNSSSSNSNGSINSTSRIRRCLLFDSPNNSRETVKNYSTLNKTGASMDLALNFKNGELFVNVIRCKNLTRNVGGQINAYVKVALTEKFGDTHKKQQGAIVQRTAVQANSTGPIFNHVFKLSIFKCDFNKKKLVIEVWHRDRNLRRSEFLGCMSFSVKNVIKKSIVGSYNLLPQTTGGCQNIPVMNRSIDRKSDDINEETLNMCESQSSVEEIVTALDEFDNELRKTTNKTILSQQQKDADENLFLRYLELDPLEGPDAIPAALQRKATGNQSGRTPFTTTKKLMRLPRTGFGFSVVWTHPPRIERVEKGLPADKAGILPGDYIIFVDKHNVVMMPEIDILNLIRSYGNTLTLEIFRRNTSRNGSVPSVRRLTSTGTESTTGLPLPQQRRPSTVCSTNTTSVEYNRKRLQLPQIAFNVEKPPSNEDEARKKAMYQILSKEQQYATNLQFAITRFVSALAERKDLITSAEHRILFQNCEEILHITEDILDTLLHEDGEHHLNLLLRAYNNKLNEMTTAYKRYCTGIKKADCVLANKTKCSDSEFVRFLQTPPIPRKRPDITVFIHKPLEHYRELLKLFNVILSNTKSNHEDYPVISQIVHDLQISYREITAGAGLMEPVGEGRPLLSVQDLENRLVFTKCKPFVLSKPGRQWIFGGDLSRVEGRNVRQYWTLLFSDILMFAKVSRDRVLFIIEDPLPLSHITELSFNIRKKANEFRITVEPGGKTASSPTVHCGPDLTRTPKKNANRKCLILRAPTLEMKAVWQNLLQRQIFHVNAGTDGSSFSSPLESPDAPITSSVATLQSAESLSLRRQTPHSLRQSQKTDSQRQIDELIEHKCKQLSKSSSSSKCNAIHLEQWMKGEFGYGNLELIYNNNDDIDNIETWTDEMFRKRSEELNLIDTHGNICVKDEFVRNVSRCEDITLSDHDQSPSRSTTTESQVTVRSSPVVPETVSVCRQCHKTCLSNNSNNQNGKTNNSGSSNNLDMNINSMCQQNNNNINNNNNPSNNNVMEQNVNEDWRPLMLMGLSAINPAASLVKLDPFSAPVPKISVVPPTPDNLSVKNTSIETNLMQNNCNCQITKPQVSELILNNDYDYSPDDSPQTEEQPYHSLNSSSLTLRRFGTVSSLERSGVDENEDVWLDKEDDNSSESDDEYDKNDCGVDNEGFSNYSIRTWTARAGSFVAEKMAFFERLGENYRSGFFEGYLRTSGIQVNGDEVQEEETSGATSGEEIWGTPTSGGEMDEPLSSPNYDERSPYEDSLSSGTGEDTELMMDELLMTPPVSAAAIRGLLPRRTLEPLMEEEYSESCTSSSSTSTPTEPSPSPDQGNGTGDVADECSVAATTQENEINSVKLSTQIKVSQSNSAVTTTTKIHRSESYRHIIEAEDHNINFFNRFKPTMKFVNIEKIPKSRGVKLLDFFNVKVGERKIHESYPHGRHPIKVFNSKDDEDEINSCAQKTISPRRLRDKQLDRRFWKHLSRRRGNKSIESAA